MLISSNSPEEDQPLSNIFSYGCMHYLLTCLNVKFDVKIVSYVHVTLFS